MTTMTEQKTDYATKENTQVGDTIAIHWGCTMSGFDFYQVLEISGSRVKLGHPLSQSEGNQEGYTWITGKNPNPEHTMNAKFTPSGLIVCHKPGSVDWRGKSNEWLTSKSSWTRLRHQPIGKREYFHGD